MYEARLIARLDVKAPFLVKGIQFEGLRKLGEPGQFARQYYSDGIDEIYYEDTVASLYDRNSIFDIIRETTEDVFVPITVGGGLRSLDDVGEALKAGADKIAVNTAAIKRPKFLNEIRDQFGSQCIVLSVQAKKIGGMWEAYYDNGREPSGIDALEWIQEGEARGVGEVLLTSVDKDGTREGFDIELMQMAGKGLTIPLVASGGMGKTQHCVDVIKTGGADAVAMATVLHYAECELPHIRATCKSQGIRVRET
ncbi:MAG: imidazole glycerol phosphate synthase cyclase subunit [Luminiphilus sp.]|nr:imidazole glycerol phosphate synthase cyclase subunit [Luminiphilus sp.]